MSDRVTRSSTAARGGGGRAALLYARADWRSRWRSHLLIAVVVAVAVAGVVATFTAATRSETAFERLRMATHAADMDASFPDMTSAVAAARAIARIDGVERAAADAELFVRPAGSDYFPNYNLYARAPIARHGVGVNAPVIVAGRLANPGRADEIAMSEDLAAALGVSVGDTIGLESMTTGWVDVAFDGGDPGPPDGPKLKVVVVGLARTPADFTRLSGVMHLSPAFVERYDGRLRIYPSVQVRLTRAASRPAVLRALTERTEDVEIRSRLFGDDTANGGLDAIATALRTMAVIAALAGGTVMVFALARAARLSPGERRVLVALGWTRRQLAESAVLVFAPWVLLGTGIGIFGGVMLAPRALVGLARKIDPSPTSITIDDVVVLAVAVATVAFGLVVVGFTAGRTARVRPAQTRRPARILALRRPLSVLLGVRNALSREADRGGRASRGALVVMAAALAGSVAALLVGASIARLQTDPLLIGQGEGRGVDSGESVDVYDRVLPRLEKDRRVATLAGIHIVFNIELDGSRESTMLAYDIRRGDLGASVIRGRIARHADEVAVGPATLDQVGKDIGDRIDVRGETGRVRFRIVGVVLFPEGDFDHDAGVAVTARGANRVAGNVHDAADLHSVVYEWADGVDTRSADRELTSSGFQVITNDNALKPASVSNLGEVATLPRYLAGFLGVLALATFGHALSVSVRRGVREFGTMRALGLTRPTGSAVVAVHALTVVGIAIVVGVPLGLAIGTRIWTPIAEGAHVVVLSVTPAAWISLQVAAMAAMAGVLTAIPAYRVFRLRAADALRTE